MNDISVNTIIDILTEKLIEKSIIDAALPSTGVLRQSSWFTSSLMFIMLDCFNSIDMFDEDDKESLFDVYNKQMLM